MENISHSLPKRSFSSNPNAAAFTSHKSVYDDVFGGPPKLGLPTLAPRLEDYSEIFGGFHASRSSSIPVLDLPLIVHDSNLHFDVRSSGFDYTEVFGDFGGLDFTASFEDLVGQSSGGYDSSDEPWYAHSFLHYFPCSHIIYKVDHLFFFFCFFLSSVLFLLVL